MYWELEYAKKIALLRKLFREGLLSDREYHNVRSRLNDMYLFSQSEHTAEHFQTA